MQTDCAFSVHRTGSIAKRRASKNSMNGGAVPRRQPMSCISPWRPSATSRDAPSSQIHSGRWVARYLPPRLRMIAAGMASPPATGSQRKA